jgi:hypothetical protein
MTAIDAPNHVRKNCDSSIFLEMFLQMAPAMTMAETARNWHESHTQREKRDTCSACTPPWCSSLAVSLATKFCTHRKKDMIVTLGEMNETGKRTPRRRTRT